MAKTFPIGTAAQKQPGGLFPGSAKSPKPASIGRSGSPKLPQTKNPKGR